MFPCFDGPAFRLQCKKDGAARIREELGSRGHFAEGLREDISIIMYTDIAAQEYWSRVPDEYLKNAWEQRQESDEYPGKEEAVRTLASKDSQKELALLWSHFTIEAMRSFLKIKGYKYYGSSKMDLVNYMVAQSLNPMGYNEKLLKKQAKWQQMAFAKLLQQAQVFKAECSKPGKQLSLVDQQCFKELIGIIIEKSSQYNDSSKADWMPPNTPYTDGGNTGGKFNLVPRQSEVDPNIGYELSTRRPPVTPSRLRTPPTEVRY